MFDYPQLVTLEAVENNPVRLTPSEVNEFVDFAFLVHNHTADAPSKPIFCWRTDSDDVRSCWN
jgi:hypothetical protein